MCVYVQYTSQPLALPEWSSDCAGNCLRVVALCTCSLVCGNQCVLASDMCKIPPGYKCICVSVVMNMYKSTRVSRAQCFLWNMVVCVWGGDQLNVE